MVEQVKAGIGGGLVLKIVAHPQPGLSCAVGVGAGGLELLLVKLLAGELLQLRDGRVELRADIGDVGVVYRDGVVIGNVDHNQGHVAHTGDVFVPLGHAVADVVAAQHEVGLGHTHLTVGLDGLPAQVLFPAVGQSLDLVDVVQDGVGLHGLGVLLGLAGLRVDDHLAVLVLQGLAAGGVDDVLARGQVDLAGSPLAGGIGQGNTGIAADIIVKTQVLGGLTHDLAVPVGGNTGGLVLRVHHVQVKRRSQLAGELGAGPAHQLASLLGLAGVRVHVLDDLAQGQDAGAYLLCHKSFPPQQFD